MDIRQEFRDFLNESKVNVVTLKGNGSKEYVGIEINTPKFSGKFFVNPNGNGEAVEVTAQNYVKKIKKLKSSDIEKFINDEIDSYYLTKY